MKVAAKRFYVLSSVLTPAIYLSLALPALAEESVSDKPDLVSGLPQSNSAKAPFVFDYGGQVRTEIRDNFRLDDKNPEDERMSVLSAGIKVKSNFEHHAVGGFFSVEAGTATENENADYVDLDIGATGRFDIDPISRLKGYARFLSEHIEIKSKISEDLLAKKPTRYNNYLLGASYIRDDMENWALEVEAGLSSYDYKDGRHRDNTHIENDDRDRTEFKVEIQTGAYIKPSLLLYGYARSDLHTYHQRIDGTAVVGRDSEGQALAVGIRHKSLDNRFKSNIRLGIAWRDYEDSQQNDPQFLLVHGKTSWTPNENWNLSAQLTRDAEEIAVVGIASRIATNMHLSGEWTPDPDLRLFGGYRFLNETYQANILTANDRTDNTHYFNVGAGYQVFEGVWLELEFLHHVRNSTVKTSEYKSNTIFGRISIPY